MKTENKLASTRQERRFLLRQWKRVTEEIESVCVCFVY